MASAFDAYHKWLGIPPSEQPPNHYRLLGIAQFESDPDVIDAAADQRMAHLRTYQNGPHSAKSQSILNEIAAARLCLLNQQRKLDYDQRLRSRVPASTGELETIPSVPWVVTSGKPEASLTRRKSKAPKPKLALAVASLLVFLAGVTGWIIFSRRQTTPLPNQRPDTEVVKNLITPPQKEKQSRPKTGRDTPPATRAIASPAAPTIVISDRAAAEWVLGLGGKLVVGVNGEARQVQTAQELPAGTFELWNIDLSVRPAVDDAGMAHFSGLRNVRSIDLSSTPIGDLGVEQLGSLVSLEYLGLGATKTTDRGLAALRNLANLRSLGLNFTAVTGSGLATLSHFQELRGLDLSAIQLGDEGLRYVSQLNKLDTLALNFTDITDKRISQVSALHNLSNLSLIATALTDDAVPDLSDLRQLKYLTLTQTKVSEMGVKRLRESLPECAITPP